MITVEYINEQIKGNKFPNLLPDENFRKKHQQLIKDYKSEIDLYKGTCYKELNTFFKTGEIVDQSGCAKNNLEKIMKKIGNTTATTTVDMIKVVAERLEELYNIVEPYPKDVIVYRGVRRGTIGQNMFDGDCVKTRLYSMDEHRFCNNDEMVWPKFLVDRDEDADPREYVYETLGFASTTTAISTAYAFANIDTEYDTLIALRLPAGTKFLMPRFDDYESELILFPQQNTFVLNNEVSNGKEIFYVGSFCNDINVYRPTGSPKLRALKTKILNPTQWLNEKYEKEFITVVNMCDEKCTDILHYCDPTENKCIGNTQKSRDKITSWWRNNIRGKCTKKKVNECIDNNSVCDPDNGNCFSKTGSQFKDTDKLRKIANYRNPKELIAAQKPHLNCTEEKIKDCAKNRYLCKPTGTGCWQTDNATNIDDSIYMANNVLDDKDIANRVPIGKCTSIKLGACLPNNSYCNPDTGKCVGYYRKNDPILKKVKKMQAKNKPKFLEIVEDIRKKQLPNGKCTIEMIDKCANRGQFCKPYGDDTCLQSDKDYYQKKNIINDAFVVNNMLEFNGLPTNGQCNKGKKDACDMHNQMCSPTTGCFEITPENIDKINSLKEYIAKVSKRKQEIKDLIGNDEKILKNLATQYGFSYIGWLKLDVNINEMIAHELKSGKKITQKNIDEITAKLKKTNEVIEKRTTELKKWVTKDIANTLAKKYNFKNYIIDTLDTTIENMATYEQTAGITFTPDMVKSITSKKPDTVSATWVTTPKGSHLKKNQLDIIDKLNKTELIAALNYENSSGKKIKTTGTTTTLKKRLKQYYKYKFTKVPELKKILQDKGLPTNGVKGALITRLINNE